MVSAETSKIYAVACNAILTKLSLIFGIKYSFSQALGRNKNVDVN
ncbi:hypothetical protein PPEP_b1013 [Pseudoalteromonas peptidolytica F12-50-A1]|uniref:Uncharacterized protein n=1 Tax=Pseudoalteromonas peptidolytica F12-50-A1 TaxID=1315280 RepID=A0A8I0T6F8_9GAMM|nr:hypothetical protein [Pseudoalteromonas peptidolytica F12-50-A1]